MKFLVGYFFILLHMTACTSPAIDTQAATKYGFSVHAIRGDPFLHSVMQNSGQGNILHVYIEGDGRPWINETLVAADPTPSKLIMPELMAQDRAAAIYLGRPCYFQTGDLECTAKFWTSARYSPEVVQSLNTVLDQYAKDYSGVILIGHSGGGTLAMLMAANRRDVKQLITLAGNLDITRWAEQHHYSPLSESVNPAKLPPLSSSIIQQHFLGAKDEKITPAMILPVIEAQPRATLVTINGLNHSCCWSSVWPDILASLISK